MKLSFSRGRLLAGAALGAGLAALASAPAQADSTCAFGSTSLGGAAIGVDCTSVNGNGHTEIGGGLSASGTLATAPAVVVFGGAPTNGLTTGYIESTTAGKDVLDISSTVDFSYLGTGSTLVGQAGATGATTLDITAPSVTFNSGNLTALGAGSNALTVTANGGAGSGGINGTVDGNVTSAAGPAIVLTTTNAAGDGAVTLTSALGTTIQATGGNAVTLTTAGSGPIDVTLNGTVIGNTNVHAVGPVTNAAGTAINVDLTNAASTSNVTVAADAAVSGTSGIDATNAGTGGLTVTTGTGLVTGTAGSAINADQTNAASASNVLVTVGTGGATGTGADAVAASTAGSGTVTVNSAGPVASTAGAGINAQSNTGAANVNVTGGTVTGTTSGVLATSTSGPVTVALTNGADVNATAGNGIDVASSGAKIVNVGAGSVVTGTGDAILATGGSTVTVNNSGTVGTAGGVSVFTDGLTAATINNQTGGVLNGRVDLSGGNDTINNVGTVNFTGANNFLGGTDAINNNAGGTVNVAAGTSFTGLEALNNAGTLAATSGMLFDAGNTAITNTGTFTAGGAIDLGAGTDSIANNAGGTLTFAAGSSLLGVETLTNAGTLTANSGLLFDAGNTAVTNTGTINTAGTLDFGAGTDSLANNGTGVINLTGATTLANLETFTNAGRINLNTFTLTGAGAFTNTGTIDTNGSAGLAGFTSLSNSGTLDLAAGTFTVPAAVFTNTGTILADEGATTITGQTSFANSGTLDLQDGAVGDTLTINSAFVGSGGSTLAVDFNDTTSDLLVINGAASGSTAVDANYIGAGLFNLAGVQVVDATTATAGAFVLGDVTGNTSPIADYSLVQNGGDFFLVSAPNASAFDPLAVTGLVTTMWYQSADEVLAETHKPATTVGMSFWGDVYWSRDKYGDNNGSATIAGTTFDFDNRLKTKRKGLQLGVDYGFGSGRVGATAGYATAKADNDSDLSDVGLKAKGWNLGLYGQFGGITGFHGEFLAKYDKYNGDFNNGVFDGTNVDFHEFGIDGSAGYRFGIGGTANLDASVGLSHVVSKVDDIEAFGASYDIGKITSTRGRAGLRATFGGGLAPYIDGTVYHEFNGDGNIALFDGATTYDLDTNGKATWFRLEGGLSGNDGPGPILAAWADLGDKKGIGLRAGWRLGGRMAEAAPPPPPPVAVAPPPPPPPATQTCPDGSVILATDACPPPPPPPPPPPMPERG